MTDALPHLLLYLAGIVTMAEIEKEQNQVVKDVIDQKYEYRSPG